MQFETKIQFETTDNFDCEEDIINCINRNI